MSVIKLHQCNNLYNIAIVTSTQTKKIFYYINKKIILKHFNKIIQKHSPSLEFQENKINTGIQA